MVRRNTGKIIGALCVVLLFVIALSFVLPPIQDRQVLTSADPAMKSLAEQAGLNREGELIFLRTHPKLDSTTQMATDCSVKNSKDGYVEQGCFDPAHNRIYIRDISDDLQPVEIVTAAHEMLHAAYINLSTNERKNIDQALEEQVATLHDKTLSARLKEYAKLEPAARDNELHSILGSEYSSLSPTLETYYAKYFTNRKLVMAANKQVGDLFKHDQQQLVQLQKQVDADRTNAANLYAQSASAANRGDATADDYYYSLYTQKVATTNKEIDQYNQLITEYNTLASEYNGQPASQLQAVQQSQN